MARKPSTVGLLLSCLATSLVLQPIRAGVEEANSAYEFAKLIQRNTEGARQILHVQNYTVTAPSTSVLMQVKTEDRCSCQSICDAIIPACSVMSYDSATKTCTLSNAIKRATLTPGATYTYAVPSSSRITKEKDGLYYYMDLTRKVAYFAAQWECYQRGFRLAISRSVATSKVFKAFHDRYPDEDFWIGLTKNDGKPELDRLRWGDGTTVDSASISATNLVQDGWFGSKNSHDALSFIIDDSGNLNDAPKDVERCFLCQANLDRMPGF